MVRINLSDQTDISDLFGSDLSVEGGAPGQFSWVSGPFLAAMERGDWILLDKLNLASQSVLKGLNAMFDHRGEVYVPVLDRVFPLHPGTKIFGCQNPLTEGGDRKVLPQQVQQGVHGGAQPWRPGADLLLALPHRGAGAGGQDGRVQLSPGAGGGGEEGVGPAGRALGVQPAGLAEVVQNPGGGRRPAAGAL